jgi:hypothetical protein
VNADGPLECRLRPGGPDGSAATPGDDAFPSAGNCLLFEDAPAGQPQPLRTAVEVAATHPASQALFQRICALTLDKDTDPCLGDLNEFTLFTAVSSVLGGGDLIAGLAVDGLQFAHRSAADPEDPFDEQRLRLLGPGVFAGLFADLPEPNDPTDFSTDAISQSATPEAQALLGCGPAYLTPCDAAAAAVLRANPVYAALLELTDPFRLRGGIDFLNADAGAITQEFTVVKVLSRGDLVGVRAGDDGSLRFEAGISGAGHVDPLEATMLGAEGWQQVRDRIALDRFGVPFAQLASRGEQLRTATDYNVEPSKWLVDEDVSTWGVLLFRDPRGPNGVWEGGSGDDVVDPAGEECSGMLMQGAPDPGCTALEVVSANLERLTMASEIIGPDRVFDPPQTVAELLAMLDGDSSNDLLGDPVAGPDGVRFNDFDANSDGGVEDGISEQGDQKVALAKPNQVVVASFRDCLLGTATGGPVSGARECYLNLDPQPVPATNGVRATRASSDRLVAALPIGLRLVYRNPDGTLVSPSALASRQSAAFPLQRLSRAQIWDLVLQGQLAGLQRDFLFTSGELADLSAALGDATVPSTLRLTAPAGVSLAVAFFDPLSGYDVDDDGVRDMDRDNDRDFDFMDDGTPGPVSDDNVRCASGVPGDVLQELAQVEFDAEQRALLATEFPNGLPPRSPLLCRSTSALLALTGEADPGRRDFWWHGAAPDRDGDGVPDLVDDCSTIADSDQSDVDGDGVGDLCDNCVDVANPRLDSPPPSPFTTTGGQRDDDADGFGNVCDAQVVSSGPVVTEADWNEFKASIGRGLALSTCGTTGALPCPAFDLDERGPVIAAPDFNRAKAAVGSAPGPRCPACGDFAQLLCEGPGCPAP